MNSNAEYRIYNTPFYVGWQLHLILKRTGMLYQTDTSWRRIVFRVRATKDEHLMISDFIRNLSYETRSIKVRKADIAEILKDIEIWGLNYGNVKDRGDWLIVKVMGQRDLLEMFDNYYRNSLKLPPLESVDS